jgi:signal transduction histidine kinase
MLRWIRETNWLPEILLFLTSFTLLGGIDLILNKPISLVASALYCSAILFIRAFSFLAPAALVLGLGLQELFHLNPLVSTFVGLLAVFLQAAFSKRAAALATVAVSTSTQIFLTWQVTFGSAHVLQDVGISLKGESSSTTFFLYALLPALSLNALAWLLGRLLITRLTHVGTEFDRAKVLHRQARLGIEVSKQTERIGIARDLTDLLVQRISAVVSLAEGGLYAAKADINAAVRSMERIASSARDSQSELRRLYDLLHEDHALESAPPRLEDLEPLVISMRELGYNATIKVDGTPYDLNEGSELCIFKIVFEALENVKKNTPIGTDVSVDFFWTAEGLQVLVKDNGIEIQRRMDAPDAAVLEGYSAEDDLKSLVEEIDGATLSTLRERAALYEGTVDATRVAGVGFTVSALFPHLKAIAGR